MKLCYVSLALTLASSAAAWAELPDLSQASGSVLIAAPTDAAGPTNQGIWFVNPGDKSFSLTLPELPTGKVYEGWIVDACTGIKTSTGLFRAHGGIDSDSAGRYAGPLALDIPPVPGSDFVTLGSDLADGGHRLVITVEPYPDSDPNPSGIALLGVTIPENTAVGTVLQLQNLASLPAAVAFTADHPAQTRGE
ncbi:MAG: hypothetical protein AB7F86_08050 [Bdellovibrionales bacterium]